MVVLLTGCKVHPTGRIRFAVLGRRLADRMAEKRPLSKIKEVRIMGAIIIVGLILIAAMVVGSMVYGVFLGLARLARLCKRLWLQSVALDAGTTEVEGWGRWEQPAGR